jgi:two-component system, LytTR family, response regulator LytT
MNVVIIEDEKIAARRLVDMLNDARPEVNVLNVLDSVEACVSYFTGEPQKSDLIFMDIELSDGQSFDIFQHIKIHVPVIFITAYQEHALRAFKLNSVDYLLKPLKKEELVNALDKFDQYHNRGDEDINAKVVAVLQELKKSAGHSHKERFLARNGTRLTSIPVDQIAYFYTKEKFQYIKTVNNDDFIIDKRLDEIEGEIDIKRFFRANRQFILNYESIERVFAWFSGKLKVQVTPVSYEEIIVSRLKATEFKKWLGD